MVHYGVDVYLNGDEFDHQKSKRTTSMGTSDFGYVCAFNDCFNGVINHEYL